MKRQKLYDAATLGEWQADLPPRSMLFSVSPCGVDGSTREHIVSFFRRTADAHAVLPRSLAYNVLVPLLALPSKYSEDLMAAECYRLELCGLSTKAERWADAFMQLTRRSDLHLLTLLPLRNLASPYKLIASVNRFCPACYAEDERAKRPKYDRLLWAISCVSACPKHELRLITEPNIKSQRALPYTVPGVSRRDGRSLAKRFSTTATKCEVVTARLVADLLDDVSRFGSHRESHAPAFLTHVANLLFDGNFAVLAKHLELSKSQVHGWMHKGILPSLHAVARIAYAFDCRISDVLLGNQPPVRLQEGFSLPRGVFGLKRNTGHRVPHQKLLDSLSEFMCNNPHACAQGAANHLEISTKFLRKNFPVQNLALVHGGRLHRRHMAQLRKNAKESAYQQSYLALVEAGVYPCRRKVIQRLKEQGLSLTFAEESRATRLGFPIFRMGS